MLDIYKNSDGIVEIAGSIFPDWERYSREEQEGLIKAGEMADGIARKTAFMINNLTQPEGLHIYYPQTVLEMVINLLEEKI